MRILRNCLLLSLLPLLAGFSAFGKKYPALKVEKFRELMFLVEGVEKNGAGLTKEDLEKAVKLKLLGVGIKPTSALDVSNKVVIKSFLYLKLDILPDASAFFVTARLRKFARPYDLDPKVVGPYVDPHQGAYGFIGRSTPTPSGKAHILLGLNEALDLFLLDYLESNVE